MRECPYCRKMRTGEGVVAENELAVALWDQYPLNPGHTLIVPRRHEGDYFKLTAQEQTAIVDLMQRVKTTLDVEFAPAAYNVGLNSGPAAGQTIPHTHVHLIPRYLGDVPDPRGGVRWIIPERAPYWQDGQS